MNIRSSFKLKNILYNIFLTSNVFYISFCLLFILLSWMLYLSSSLSSFDLFHLESEKTSTALLCWFINIFALLLLWNTYAFIFLNVYMYSYSKGSGDIMLTMTEEVYNNPIAFALIIYFMEKSFFSNVIDNSFWFLIIMNYYFISFHLIQFFKRFDSEIAAIKKVKSDDIKRKLKGKIKHICVFFFICNVIFTSFVYVFLNSYEKPYRYVILGKGVYIAIKIIELYFTRKKKFLFLTYDVANKEKNFVWNLKLKMYLEETTMIFIYFQLYALITFDEEKNVPFQIGFHLILLHQIYKGIVYYRKYEYMKECFRNLDSALKNKITNCDDDCVICTDKLNEARVLTCGHSFHLICLGKWFLKGYKTCPVCKEDINVEENPNGIIHPTRNQRRESTFDLNLDMFFGYMPTIRIRIVRDIDEENT